MQELVVEFGNNGVVPWSSWPTIFNSTSRTSYNVALLHTPSISVVTNWRVEECTFWSNNDFDQYAWNS